VGSHILSTELQGRLALLESKLMLQGPLGNSTVMQRSKVHRQRFFSLLFSEETQELGSKRMFQVLFDTDKGLVIASKSPNDRTEMPLTLPYLDPLSLLYRLRFFSPEEDLLRLPLLGKTITVERVTETELDTALGKRPVWVYQLYPGGSLVYVDRDEPHAILMMSQRFDAQILDAQLISIEEASRFDNRQPKQNRSRPRRRYRGKPRS
jgi:hypothetical protein